MTQLTELDKVAITAEAFILISFLVLFYNLTRLVNKANGRIPKEVKAIQFVFGILFVAVAIRGGVSLLRYFVGEALWFLPWMVAASVMLGTTATFVALMFIPYSKWYIRDLWKQDGDDGS